MTELMATRDGYGNALVKLGAERNDVVVLDADLSKSTRTEMFEKNYPDRFFNIGVAEQDLIGTAAGLALGGKTVFASSFAIFASGRAWEQIRNSVCIDKLDVKIVATHGGISVGPDGASHQAIEDITIMRVIPNIKVVVPCDGISAEKLILEAAETPGPFYIRLGRSKVPKIISVDQEIKIGKGIVLKEGEDVLIISCGMLTPEALGAADILKEKGISAGVVDMHTIKPIDIELLKQACKKYKKIVTVEEHSILGGLGGAVAEALMEIPGQKPDFLRLGLKDEFGQSGEMNQLIKAYGLDSEGIAKAISNC
jgi:transketolase